MRAVITVFIAMVLFVFTGHLIFDFFNIAANGFRMVGGILFFLIGYDMLNARITRSKISRSEVKEYTTDISNTVSHTDDIWPRHYYKCYSDDGRKQNRGSKRHFDNHNVSRMLYYAYYTLWRS